MGNILGRLTGNQALRERLAESEGLRLGTYYSTVADVWTPSPTAFSQESLDSVRRQYRHQFYRKSVEAALGEDLNPAYESGRSEHDPGSSLDEDSNDSKTDLSRKRRLKEIAFDGKKHETAEVAHLIPFAPKCASFFAPLAEAAAGVDFNENDEGPDRKKQRRMVLIHGQKKVQQNQGEGSQPKKHYTGMKHCRSNMARVVAQKQYLDFNPSHLLIPILTLQDTLDYGKDSSKKKYEVLVVCTTPEVYTECLWRDKYDACSEADFDKATKTLASFVKAAAHTLSLANEEELELKLKNPQKKQIIKARAEIMKEKKVKVPEMRRPWRDDTRLIKVTLDMENPNAHQECDPFLLFVKAAVVWSSIQEQLLLPGCPLPHNCEDCLDDSLFQCVCEAYDPDEPIPNEIYIVNGSGGGGQGPRLCHTTSGRGYIVVTRADFEDHHVNPTDPRRAGLGIN